MANFTFNCPECNQPLETQDEWRGQETQCPSCSAMIKIPTIVQCRLIKPQLLAPDERKCPKCGEIIKKEAVFCRWCKQHIPPQNFNNFNSYANTPPNVGTYWQNSEISLTERLCGRQAAQTGKFSVGMIFIYLFSILFFPVLGRFYLVCGIILMCKGDSKYSAPLGMIYIIFWIASLVMSGIWISIFNSL